jgi:RNA recognition motif-containing protein
MDIEDYDLDNENSLNNNQSNMNYSSNINLGTNSINNISSVTPNQNLFQNQQMPLNQNNPNLNNAMKFNKMPFSDYRHEKNILYISDLPYNTNETDIKLFFKRYGDNVSLITIRDPKYHKENDTRPISAKVIFKDYATANKARIEMNLRKLKGHAIRLMWEERDNSVRYNSTTNLFIKGIPFNVQPREVYEYFIKFGDISSAKLKENQDGNHLGYGYVTYYKPESAELAIKNTNGKMMWGGGPLQVDYFKKKNERLSTAGPEVFKLYITNFPGDFTEQNIVELTKEFGAIISCSIKTEKIGRRYALVCYENEEAANRAKASLEGKNVYGYNLFCKIVNDKSYPNPNEVKINKNNNNNFRRFFQRNKPGFINTNNNMCNLFIKEIPYMIKEKQFIEIFSQYGKITSAKLETYNLITNIGDQTVSTPTSKGYGYVCYEDQEVAKKVKDELNGKFLPGYEHWKNPLIIEYYLSKSQKEVMNNMIENNNFSMNNNNGMYMPQMNQQYINNYKNMFDYNKFNSLKNEESKKEYLGEIIYDQVYNSPLITNILEKDKVTAKITGMILGIGNTEEIIRICTDIEALNKNISDSLTLLNNNNYDYNS